MSLRGTQLNKLFVGQVPNNTTEENLREIFAPYGTVSEVMFLKNKVTGQHRGCAFVSYETTEEAQAAIDAMNDKVTLEGAKRTMILRVAGQNRPASEGGAAGGDHKLYIGMLSKSTTVEDLRTMFESYGNVVDAFLMHEKGDPTKSRGCGFVKFGNREECVRAISALHGNYKDKDAPQQVQVRFARTQLEKDNMQQPMGGGFNGMQQMGMNGMNQAAMGMGPMGWQQNGFGGAQDPYSGMGMQQNFMQQNGQDAFGGMQGMGGMNMYGMGGQMGGQGQGQGGQGQSQGQGSKGPTGANLFVYGIPDSYRDADLSTLFSSFGAIVSSKVQTDSQTGRAKGFGFVSFSDASVANAAISAMDGFVLQGRKLNVRVKKGDGGDGPSNNRFTPY